MARVDDLEEDCKEMINVEESLSAYDLKPLIAAAKKCENESRRVETEKSHFNDMVVSLAAKKNAEETTIKEHLQGMKVYKIYPKYKVDTLPPPRVVQTFMGTQLRGDVKTPNYNDRSLFGLVDGFF